MKIPEGSISYIQSLAKDTLMYENILHINIFFSQQIKFSTVMYYFQRP